MQITFVQPYPAIQQEDRVKYQPSNKGEHLTHSLPEPDEDKPGSGTVGKPFLDDPRITCRHVNVYYGVKHAGLRQVDVHPLLEPHERHH